MLKVGLNFEDCNRAREWAAEGKSPAEISQLIRVEESAIAQYLGSLEETPAEPDDDDE